VEVTVNPEFAISRFMILIVSNRPPRTSPAA